MSQIKKRFIGENQIDGSKLLLSNAEFLRSKKANGDAQNLMKLNSSDELEFALLPKVSSDPTSGDQLARKSWIDTQLGLKLDASAVGVSVAQLVDGKVPSAQLPSYVDDVLEFANLAAMPEAGETGKIYVAIDSKKVYRWSGSQYIEISPSEVNSVNGKTGVVTLDTGDISEGSNLYYTQARFDSAFGAKDTGGLAEGSNKYFTDARAKAAAVADAINSSVTDVAPSQKAVYDALALKQDASAIKVSKKETIELVGGETYVDLAHQAETDSVLVWIDGVMQDEGADFTLSVVSSKTRITFAGDLASGGAAAVAAGDKIRVQYRK